MIGIGVIDEDWVDVDCGTSFTIAKTGKGTWTWGNNMYGGLGDNTITNKSSPTSLLGNYDFIKISGGMLSAYGIRRSDGIAFSWGYNYAGQLGDNTITHKSSPVSVVGGYSFIQISGGGNGAFAAAIRGSDGIVFCWGLNSVGQLGDGTVTSRSSPVSIVGGHSFIKISCGAYHTAALKSDGSVYCWGAGDYGALGDNAGSGTYRKSTPVAVVGGYIFSQVCATEEGYSTLALTSTGKAYAWGRNIYGELGDNSTTSRSSPVSVVGNHTFIKISGGTNHSAGLKSDGSVWCWGYNFYFQLGDGTGIDKSSPVSVVGGHSFVDIVCGSAFTLARKIDGSIWGWGVNTVGQLGVNHYLSLSCMSPVSIYSSQLSFSKIATGFTHGLLIRSSDGIVFGWGNNTCGQLGINENVDSWRIAIPTSMCVNISFKDISAGANHSAGIRGSDGIAFCWGLNTYGELGDNSITSKSSPVSVVGGHSFIQINCGPYHTSALRGDGIAFCWGNNTYGQLGDGTITSRSSPVSVVGGHSFIQISGGTYYTAAIRGSDGIVFCWGSNTYGQLGDGTITSRSEPVSVLGGNSFIQISCGSETTMALRWDGIVFCWGRNGGGQIGDNSITAKSSPVSIFGGDSFVHISAGFWHSAAVRGSDGIAFCWGTNGMGQLGTNDRTSRSTPNAISCAVSFQSICCGESYTIGITSSGERYGWGENEQGYMGEGTWYSSPTLMCKHPG